MRDLKIVVVAVSVLFDSFSATSRLSSKSHSRKGFVSFYVGCRLQQMRRRKKMDLVALGGFAREKVK